MDYQTFRLVTKPSDKQQTLQRKIFAEHNYNNVNVPKTTKPKQNTQIFAQSQNITKLTSKTVNFHDHHDPHKNKVEITHFFNKINKIQINIKPEINPIIMHKIIFPQIMRNIIIKITYDFTQTKGLVLTVLSNQIFFEPYNTHVMNKYDNLEVIQHISQQ